MLFKLIAVVLLASYAYGSPPYGYGGGRGGYNNYNPYGAGGYRPYNGHGYGAGGYGGYTTVRQFTTSKPVSSSAAPATSVMASYSTYLITRIPGPYGAGGYNTRYNPYGAGGYNTRYNPYGAGGWNPYGAGGYRPFTTSTGYQYVAATSSRFGFVGPYGPYGPDGRPINGGYNPWRTSTTYRSSTTSSVQPAYTTDIVFAGLPSSLAAFPLSAVPPKPDPIAGKCGGDFKVGNGATYIKSPNFPNHYPRMANCVYRFTAAKGKRVKITFVSMNVEKHSQCVFDSIKIINGGPNGKQVAKICGNTERGFTLKFRTGTIIFKTDGSVQKNGWRAKLTAV